MSGNDHTGRLPRIYPFAVAVFAFVTAFWLSFATMLVGFPDSSFTELDRAELPLVSAFNWISLAVAAWCVCLGLAASRYRVRTAFFMTCALYAAVILASLLFDLFFRATLMDGKGG